MMLLNILFQSCLNVLTKDEPSPNSDKDETKVEVEQTTLRFIDLARQMEAFFLQKRFLLSALKPELVIKEDINELRLELGRKEELLKRHYEKINHWQNMLADVQGWAKSPAQGGPTSSGVSNGSAVTSNNGMPQQTPSGSQTSNQMGVNTMSSTLQQVKLKKKKYFV